MRKSPLLPVKQIATIFDDVAEHPMATDATELLEAVVAGNRSATDGLFPLIYDELHRLAAALLAREGAGHTLQPTALVHEVYLRLIDQTGLRINDQRHFVGIAALAMRQVLVDHARHRGAEKRGGGYERVPLDTTALGVEPGAGAPIDVISLDEALTRLAALNSLTARVVDLRFFGGLSVEESAALLEVSPSTVEREWRIARAWLSDQLSSSA